MPSKILICSAVESEVSELFSLRSTQILVECCGIGLVDSALNLSRILSVNPEIEIVFFTGTCGAYPNSNLKIGECVTAKRHVLLGVATILMKSYLPEKMIQEIELDLPKDHGFRSCASATVLEITKDKKLAQKIEEMKQVEIEQMELFSIARVVQEFDKVFFPLVGVSNLVSEKSHEEWLQFHKEVSISTQKVLKNYIKNNFYMYF